MQAGAMRLGFGIRGKRQKTNLLLEKYLILKAAKESPSFTRH